jgi:predicted Zn-dependent protease
MPYLIISIVTSLLLSSAWSGKLEAQSNLSLPDFGDPSEQYLSAWDESRLGRAVMLRIRERGAIIDDVQLNEYLASVGQHIAAYADSGGIRFTLFWVKATSINAFAAPGGFVGMHAGLLLATKSEDELAGVLAHEIAHVTQHHVARAIADAQSMAIPTAAAVVASILLGTLSDGRIGSAAMTGALAASQQRQINFTRANEQEADRIGTDLLYRSGFDPDGLPKFFARLEKSSGGGPPEFLRTHPYPRNRIADVQNRINRPYRRRTGGDDLNYYLAKARMRVVITRNTSSLIRRFETLLEKGGYANVTAARYGYALALKRAGRLSEAENEINRLLKSYPDRLAFRVEAADIALAKGNRDRAWRLYEETRSLYPGDFTLAMFYGQALSGYGNPRKAMQVLEPHLRRRPQDASLHGLYAQAAQRAGNVGASHATLTEYYYLTGNLEMAIEQAEMGLENPTTSSYQKARLRARLRELKEEALAQKR